MVEPPEEAAAEACLAAGADVLLLDLAPSSAGGGRNPNRSPPAVDGPVDLFLDLFDPAEGFPGLETEGGGGEEEELEWLANKDAFPSLETSFEFPAHSGGGGAASAAEERPSPVSVLVAAFRVPARPRSKGRRRRRKVLSGISPRPPERLPPATAAVGERRRCRHCEAEETPQWRAGPEGPKTLCNACGVRYKSGRLVPEYRPANSPTFSAAIHSNSHRQILEMRRGKPSGAGRGRRSRRAAQSASVAGRAM